MRRSLSLLIVILCLVVPGARAQAQSAGTVVRRPGSAHGPRTPSAATRSPGAHGVAPHHGGGGKAGGVLALGATDITGNKELPKVMVIVPWKGSLGAGGVIKPTDSLLDEALAPVDRDVFQRQIHYYGQLKAKGKQSAVGDR